MDSQVQKKEYFEYEDVFQRREDGKVNPKAIIAPKRLNNPPTKVKE